MMFTKKKIYRILYHVYNVINYKVQKNYLFFKCILTRTILHNYFFATTDMLFRFTYLFLISVIIIYYYCLHFPIQNHIP